MVTAMHVWDCFINGGGVTEQGMMGTVVCQRSEGQCLVFGSKVRLFICV